MASADSVIDPKVVAFVKADFDKRERFRVRCNSPLKFLIKRLRNSFRRRTHAFEMRKSIQVLVIEHHRDIFQPSVDVHQIHDHPRHRIDGSCEMRFEQEVVTEAIGSIEIAIHQPVLVFA